jgi:PAS domain S-box-containing protein
MKNPRLAAAGLFLAIFIAGALLAWWMAVQADRRMRADLLQQTQMVAQAVEIGRIQALSGTAADLDNPVYLRLKEQLATVRSAYPQCRFIYLIGRRAYQNAAAGQPAPAVTAQADNAVFFFVDSEPSGSKDYSPPGQIYAEVPEGYRRVFSSRTAAVAGPVTDRWGTWVTSLVPIHDPQTATYGLATPDDAKAVVRRALDFYQKNGRERLLAEISNPRGEFRSGDLYAFAYDRDMTMLAHPVKPELVGLNQLDVKDVPGGKFFRREIRQVVLTQGSGWVDYEYENPVNKQIEPKTTFVAGVDDLIVCAGAYKGSGAILAVLGMDIDERDWNRMRIRAVLPPVLLTLALVWLLSMGALLLARRPGHVPGAPNGLRHIETGAAVAIGLTLSLFAAWMAHTAETRSRNDAFAALASNQTARVAEKLRDIRGTELEGLACFYAGSEKVTTGEFQQFTQYLTKDPAVFAWEWAPAVPAADRMRFETEARAAGLPGFEIWQKDDSGQVVPASGRKVYYPVFQIAPMAGNERALGYDLGSEPLRRAALEEAVCTGLPTATDPVTLVQETGGQKGMLLYRPVFEGDDPGHLRGFGLAVLRMGTLLRSGLSDNADIELALLRKDAAPEPLAMTWDTDSPPDAALFATRPVLAFGKVFAVTAHAGSEFMRMHPVRAGWLTFLTGMALTAAIAAVIRLTLRRKEELEQLVAERTLDLQESEQSYRNQFASNSSVMLLIDPNDGTIIDANAAALDFYGHSRERLLAMRITDINTLPASEVQRAMASIPDQQGKRFHFQHRLADGSIRDVEASISRIQFGKRLVLHSIIQDITDRRKAEEERIKLEGQLQQAQKMESVGRLAGGVAHDFNNMLGAILGHAELAIAQMDPSHKVFASLLQIQKAALRSADLTRQLLAFARKQTVAPKVLDLNETVGGMLDMLERLIGEDIDLNWLPKADLWPVKVDPSQIDQILANLCVNARDAIADVGRISIETGNCTFDADYCAIHAGFAPGEYVMLAVSDDGCGLDRDTLAHIFEPFFTTKEVGKGTGLGLATVYGIVKQNNGFINVYSEPKQGTRFTIYLPRHAGKAPRMQKEAPAEPAASCHETVLLVEDEPALLEMITIMLEMQGYAVLAANTPGEAIRLAGAHAGGVHLLMTDVVMPGMNGRDLAKNLLSLYPHIRCLFMSGYTADVIAHHGVLDEGMHFIQKPFSATELSARVREALDDA